MVEHVAEQMRYQRFEFNYITSHFAAQKRLLDQAGGFYR